MIAVGRGLGGLTKLCGLRSRRNVMREGVDSIQAARLGTSRRECGTQALAWPSHG